MQHGAGTRGAALSRPAPPRAPPRLEPVRLVADHQLELLVVHRRLVQAAAGAGRRRAVRGLSSGSSSTGSSNFWLCTAAWASLRGERGGRLTGCECGRAPRLRQCARRSCGTASLQPPRPTGTQRQLMTKPSTCARLQTTPAPQQTSKQGPPTGTRRSSRRSAAAWTRTNASPPATPQDQQRPAPPSPPEHVVAHDEAVRVGAARRHVVAQALQRHLRGPGWGKERAAARGAAVVSRPGGVHLRPASSGMQCEAQRTTTTTCTCTPPRLGACNRTGQAPAPGPTLSCAASSITVGLSRPPSHFSTSRPGREGRMR